MTVYLGTDISKKHLDSCFWKEGEKQPDSRPFRYSNSKHGFETKLLPRVQSYQQAGYQVVAIVEATAHYGDVFVAWLDAHDVGVVVLDPIRSRRYRDIVNLGRTKTDPTDCRALAQYGAERRPEPKPLDPQHQAARDIARHESVIANEISDNLRRLRRLVDLACPHVADLFEKLGRPKPLTLLRAYPTALKQRRARLQSMARLVPPGCSHRLGEVKARQVIEGARKVALVHPDRLEQIAWQIGDLVDHIRSLQARRSRVQERAATLIAGPGVDLVQSIPGVGEFLARQIVAEIGDIARFPNVSSLISYAGVHPAKNATGLRVDGPDARWKMAHTGNKHLRRLLFTAARTTRLHNPVVQALFQRQHRKGKAPMCIYGHAMAKVLKLIWGVWHGRRPWDPSFHSPTPQCP